MSFNLQVLEAAVEPTVPLRRKSPRTVTRIRTETKDSNGPSRRKRGGRNKRIEVGKVQNDDNCPPTTTNSQGDEEKAMIKEPTSLQRKRKSSALASTGSLSPASVRAETISQNSLDQMQTIGKKKRRTPYSKKTWKEQMDLVDQEAERARRLEEQEEKRMQRLPPLDKLSDSKLAKVRPRAPRNTTQFLIDVHADLSDDDSSYQEDDEDKIKIDDELGTMDERSKELLALREELRTEQLVT